jgi:uncharacterized protein (DUF924 family)
VKFRFARVPQDAPVSGRATTPEERIYLEEDGFPG